VFGLQLDNLPAQSYIDIGTLREDSVKSLSPLVWIPSVDPLAWAAYVDGISVGDKNYKIIR